VFLFGLASFYATRRVKIKATDFPWLKFFVVRPYNLKTTGGDSLPPATLKNIAASSVQIRQNHRHRRGIVFVKPYYCFSSAAV